MPAFPNKPLHEDALNRSLRKTPLLFGVPFVLIIVGASFALTTFTQTRYDLEHQKTSGVGGSLSLLVMATDFTRSAFERGRTRSEEESAQGRYPRGILRTLVQYRYQHSH